MVKRRKAVDSTEVQLVGKGFVEMDDNAKMFGQQATALKAKLLQMIPEIADPPDEDGHQYITLPEPVSSHTTSGKGQRREETVVGFQRQRRVSQYLDHERAEAWLKKHGFWDECTETVTTREIKEEALYQLVFDERVSLEEVEALYGENVTYALLRVTE